MTEAIWVGERLETLKRLALVEKLSASQIAKSIGGCTRNAIASACRKNGITLDGRAEPSVWTPERLEQLRKFVLEDRLSSSEIAERMECGKGSVVRACHRHGIKLARPHGSHGPAKPRLVSSTIAAARNISFAELNEHTDCKFPTTDDSPYFFCGLPRINESSYCLHHHQICYRSERLDREAA